MIKSKTTAVAEELPDYVLAHISPPAAVQRELVETTHLVLAQAVSPGGKLVACDVSGERTAYGREAWEKVGLADLIDLRIAPVLDTLRTIPTEPHIGFACLGAGKVN